MKKLLSIICVTMLLSITLITTTYANINVNLKAPTMVAKDQEFKIIIESDTELSGVNLIFKYDKNLLEFVRTEGGIEGLNAAKVTNPGELRVAFISNEPIEEPYTMVFKALSDKKTAKMKVEQLEVVVQDETAEYGIREERNIKIEDLKIKLVKESELAEGDNLQTVGKTNSAYIYIIIAVAVVVIIVVVLLVLKKKKKK